MAILGRVSHIMANDKRVAMKALPDNYRFARPFQKTSLFPTLQFIKAFMLTSRKQSIANTWNDNLSSIIDATRKNPKRCVLEGRDLGINCIVNACFPCSRMLKRRTSLSLHDTFETTGASALPGKYLLIE